ncbi:MAG: glycosyltransferase family 2 protein [Gammaproteobacteria bacterium]
MKKYPISVFIIAKNEAERIAITINSVRDWVDEIIVIDSGSQDDTVAIAEGLGAKVRFNEWPGYGQQKIFGESLCKNDWLLNLDADEEITPELKQSICLRFEQGEPDCSAYKFYWKTLFHLEDKAPPPFAAGSSCIRLYNKTAAGFRDSTVHDSVVVRSGKTEVLKGFMHHRSFENLDKWTAKVNFYTSQQAQDLFKKGRNPSPVRMLFEPFFAFFKNYFFRRYFVYGIDGFVGSFIYAYAKLMRLAKARELFYKARFNDPQK